MIWALYIKFMRHLSANCMDFPIGRLSPEISRSGWIDLKATCSSFKLWLADLNMRHVIHV